MLVQKHLLNALQSLLVYDYKKFKEFLSLKVLNNCTPIPRGLLQDVPPNGTVSVMIERYGEESAVRLTLKILKEMNFKGTAEDLEHALAAERKASPSASSPAVAPSAAARAAPGAPATMMAQQGGTIVAPNIMGSSITTMNIFIQKDS